MKISLAAKTQYKYLTYLYCVFLTIQYLCDILVFRIYHVDHLIFTASSLLFCLDFAIMDIVANIYGMKEARKLAVTNFCGQLFIGAILFAILFNYYPENTMSSSYQQELHLKEIGLTIASYMYITPFAVLIGNLSNSLLMSISKYIFVGKYIAMRSIVCSMLGAFLMLLIAYSKIYWVNGLKFILTLVVGSMVIKLIGAALLMIPTRIASNYLKVSEGIDVYDLKFKFLSGKHSTGLFGKY